MELSPFIPFEPVRTDALPHGDQWIAQIKWDGVRVLTYYDGEQVKLFNRKINERTYHFPELTAIPSFCKADSVILDGEVIALGPDGKPSFHEVMRRDGLRRMERVKEVQKVVPITYMIFDVVYFNGQWIDKLPLEQRMEILTDIIVQGEQVQLVTSYKEIDALYEVMTEQNMEGIVIKNLHSSYMINGKDQRWLKKKNYQDLHAVIGGFTKRDGAVNAVLLGIYDQNHQLWYIGHAGTGKFTVAEWRMLTEAVVSLEQKEKPFINLSERTKQAFWVQPQVVVKVQFMEWTSNKTLRQPTLQTIVDISPEKCTWE